MLAWLPVEMPGARAGCGLLRWVDAWVERLFLERDHKPCPSQTPWRHIYQEDKQGLLFPHMCSPNSPKTLQWRSSDPHFTDGKTEAEVGIVILAGGRAGIEI